MGWHNSNSLSIQQWFTLVLRSLKESFNSMNPLLSQSTRKSSSNSNDN